MTDLPSIMDKIRILRSNRIKTKPVQARANAGTVAVTPVTSSAQQQWVPFLVLDIGQPKDGQAPIQNAVTNSATPATITMPEAIPLLTAVPVSSSSMPAITKTVASSTPTTSNGTVIKTATVNRRSHTKKSKTIPVTCTITLTSSALTNSMASSKKITTVSESVPVLQPSVLAARGDLLFNHNKFYSKKSVPVSKQNTSVSWSVSELQPISSVSTDDPPAEQNTLASENVPVSKENIVISANVSLPVSTGESSADSDSLQQNERDGTTNLTPVGCVICYKHFPTLTDMQIHYLSVHKNRRGRESRKRNSDSVNSEAQKLPNLVSLQDKPNTDEPDLNMDVDETDPKCPICSIAFRSVAEVRNHVKLVHSYRCSECSDTFYTLFEFTGHKCNKGIKKSKKVRKKSSRSSNLKPEVMKVMKNFVHIQPKVKTKKFVIPAGSDKKVKSSLPLLLPKGQETCLIPINGYPTAIVSSCSIGNEVVDSTSDTVGAEQVTNPFLPELSEADRKTPPPTLTISALDSRKDPDNRRTPSPTLTISALKGKENASSVPVRVLETKNLRCFKFKKDEESSVPTTVVSKSEIIQEKLAQLQRNPQVSVSWVPKLRMKCEEDSEYVCGRCNVLCDDMEDYMDHIQDCLTITSVTLEPTSNPPQRILKLHKEVSSFGFQETNNNRYSINRNLMNKLQAVLPQIKEQHLVSSQQHLQNHSSDNLSSSSCSSDLSPPLCQKPLGDNTKNKNSNKVNVGTPLLCVKEEPLDDFPPVAVPTSSKRPDTPSLDGLTCRPYAARNSKGTQPMVIIPVDHNSTNEFQVNQNPPSSPPYSSPSSTIWESSPLDLLIDTDDIKMEVEEEIVADHFED